MSQNTRRNGNRRSPRRSSRRDRPGNGVRSAGVRDTVDRLTAELRALDPATWRHSIRVRTVAIEIATELQLEPDEVTDVALGADLHDVGKIGVPSDLLRAGRRLTESEYLQIMEHTVIGEDLLRPALADRPAVLGAVRHHHERIDGYGLPDGIGGRRIPLSARIVAVADAFDAMSHTQPYRVAALSVAAALGELARWAGFQFDPDCVAALSRCRGAQDGPPQETALLAS